MIQTMTIAKFCLTLVAMIMFQAVGPRYIRGLMYFDAGLVITVYYALQGNKISSAFIGSLIGLIQDAILNLTLGINGFSKALIGYTIALLSKKLVIESTLTQMLALLGSCLTNLIIVSGLLSLVEWKIPPDFLKHAIIQSIVTSIVGTVVLSFLKHKIEPS